MVFVGQVELAVAGFGSKFELEVVQDTVVGFDNVLFENWMKFDDLDARCAVGLLKCFYVGLIHRKLFDVGVFEQ